MACEVGFGTPNTQDFSRFTVMADSRSGVYPDWNTSLQTVVDPIIGSDSFEVQVLGFGPAEITLDLEFEDRSEFRAFQAKWGKKQTLVLLAQFTPHEGEIKHWLGHDYEFFNNTLLIAIDSPQFPVGGQVNCRATFVRSAQGMGVSSV